MAGVRKLVREAGLAIALASYALFSAPAPNRIGYAELFVALGLVAAIGLRRPLWLATGYLAVAPGTRSYEAIGAATFFYLLWVPLLRGAAMGWGVEDMARDVVPLLYLFLPVLLTPLLLTHGERGFRLLLWGMAGVGLVLAIRWWWPGLHFGAVGRRVMDEGDLYLLNSPAVLFAAIWLTLAGLDRFGQRRPVIATILLTGGALAGTALAGVVHRAALGLAALSFGCIGLWSVKRRPVLLLLVPAALFPVIWFFGDALFGTLDQVLTKTRLYGLNSREAEAAAVIKQAGRSWISLLFGDGWGALLASPAVGGMRVSYTHNLPTYMLIKTGLIGCLITLAYFGSLISPLIRVVSRQPLLAAALLPPLTVGLLFHTSFKFLCFGMLLALIVLAADVYQSIHVRRACRERGDML